MSFPLRENKEKYETDSLKLKVAAWPHQLMDFRRDARISYLGTHASRVTRPWNSLIYIRKRAGAASKYDKVWLMEASCMWPWLQQPGWGVL